MKFSTVLPFAAAASAFVLPSEEVLGNLAIEDHHQTKAEAWFDEAVSTKNKWLDSVSKHAEDLTHTGKKLLDETSGEAMSALDAAFHRATQASDAVGSKLGDAAENVQDWFENGDLRGYMDDGEHHGPPHHPGPPHPPGPPHGPPGKGPHGPGKGHHGPPHHHHKSNLTVYQLIAGSKYTTELAKLISKYDDLVEALNSTSANYTIFAPTDKAFEKIPDKAPKPSKEQLKAILSYHVVPEVYSAARVLATHTVPTLLKGEHLGSGSEPQRLALKLGLRGITVNFYSRIVAVNIFGSNGVIHGVDSILLPPPKTIAIVDLFPGEFSTLELALSKTGLLDKLNSTDYAGGTLFAPSNFAFQKLGPKVNAFLFSQYGLKYLKPLLEYHVVPKTTLYSDAIYQGKSSDVDGMAELPRRGHFSLELPTLLSGRSLRVDIARFAGFITLKVNGFASVAVQDAIAEDGVIQIVRSVLIPPKKIGGSEQTPTELEGEMTVEELKERLEPFVTKQDL